jgi:hypothetical protein
MPLSPDPNLAESPITESDSSPPKMIFQKPVFWVIVALLLIAVLIATMNPRGSSDTSSEAEAPSEVVEEMTDYLMNNPGYQSTFNRLSPILDRIQVAAESASVSGIRSGCEDLRAWTVQISPYDPPLALFKPAVEDFEDAADACLRGDYEESGEYIGRGGTKFETMSEQLEIGP